MKSSDASAASRRAPSGVLSTGLPATVTSRPDLPVARRSRSPRPCTRPPVARRTPRARRGPGSAAARTARRDPAPAARRSLVALPAAGEREHRAALTVEVAGEHVEHVDEPRRERPELLRARADAAVDRSTRRTPRARARAGGSCRRRCRTPEPPRRVRTSRASSRTASTTVGVRVEPPEIDESVGEATCARARTGTGRRCPGRMKTCSSATSAVCVRRGSTTTSRPPRARSASSRPGSRARCTASRSTRTGSRRASAGSRCGRRSGIGIDSARAEHQPRRHLLRHLVDRARGEHVRAAERLREHPPVHEAGEVVRGRVADVQRRPRRARAPR